MKKIVSVLLALVLALGLCGAFAEDNALPAYEYPYAEEDPLMAAVVKFMQETDFGYEPEEGGVLIPTPVVVKTDLNEEETEAAVYGNFWTFTYRRSGKILERTACGENPGVIRLEKKDGEWTVTSAEFAEEGTYVEDVKQIAGGDPELEALFALTTDARDDSILPQFMRAAVVGYVNANGLDIEAFQEPGSDPVPVNN